MSIKSMIAGAALAGAMASGPAAAADNSMAERFLADRLAAFGSGNVDALVAQYADDAVVITPMGTVSDKAGIRSLLQGVVQEFSLPGTKFTLISETAIGDVVTFTWSAETAKTVYDLGAETYVLKDGLATYQTLALKAQPK